MQHCAGFIYAGSLYMSGASAHHQEYLKLVQRPLVHVLSLQVSHHISLLGPEAAVLVLNTLMKGAWRPKHVEWPCRNKTCTVLHQVGVSFVSHGVMFPLPTIRHNDTEISLPTAFPCLPHILACLGVIKQIWSNGPIVLFCAYIS